MSNETKWTPGPWNNYMGDDIFCVYDRNGVKICSIEPVDIVGWNARHRDSAEANESLIAAAPELYEALGRLTEELEGTPELDLSSWGIDTREALKTLAKARGESHD